MHSAQTFVWIVEFVGKEIFALSIPSSKNTKLSVAMPHVTLAIKMSVRHTSEK